METSTRQNYIDRLVSCGYPRHRAMRTVYDFLKDHGEKELQLFIASLEKDRFYVD